jgi:Tfp pilus assembly protein PilF
MFATDLMDPPLTTVDKEAIERTYADTLVGRPVLPRKEAEVSWLYTRFEAAQDIAAAVPDDRKARLRAAVMLANFGRNDEAVERLEELLQQYPDYCDAYIILGEIHFYRGNLDQASARYLSALSQARTGKERSAINLRLGEVDLQRKDFAAARAKFEEAVRDDPRLESSIEALQERSAYP